MKYFVFTTTKTFRTKKNCTNCLARCTPIEGGQCVGYQELRGDVDLGNEQELVEFFTMVMAKRLMGKRVMDKRKEMKRD